jgi:hypothetical protein
MAWHTPERLKNDVLSARAPEVPSHSVYLYIEECLALHAHRRDGLLRVLWVKVS